MNLLTATEMAESLDIDQKTFYRWRESGKIQPKGGSDKKPLFDLSDGVAIQVAKKVNKESADLLGEMLMRSVLRRWKSKLAISRRTLVTTKQQYFNYPELAGLCASFADRPPSA